MGRIANVVTVVAILVASASATHAASDAQRCDRAKSAAVAKLFKDSLLCNHRAQFNPSFDLTSCRSKAYDRCTLSITRADTNFGAGCFYTANYDVCADTLDASLNIYPNI